MATQAKEVNQAAKDSQDAQRKVGLLAAISQLDMLLAMFGDAPERVKKAANEFRDSLKEWAG